jgi:hypothetical protein
MRGINARQVFGAQISNVLYLESSSLKRQLTQ